MPNIFGVKLLVEYYRKTFGLLNFSEYEVRILLNLIEPKGKLPKYDFSKLTSEFRKVVFTYDDLEDNFDETTNDIITNSDIKDEPKRVTAKTTDELVQETVDSHFKFTKEITLTQLLKLRVVPNAVEDVFVEMDFEIKGISYIVLSPGRIVEVYFDNHLIIVDEIFELFSFSADYINCIDIGLTSIK